MRVFVVESAARCDAQCRSVGAARRGAVMCERASVLTVCECVRVMRLLCCGTLLIPHFHMSRQACVSVWGCAVKYVDTHDRGSASCGELFARGFALVTESLPPIALQLTNVSVRSIHSWLQSVGAIRPMSPNAATVSLLRTPAAHLDAPSKTTASQLGLPFLEWWYLMALW